MPAREVAENAYAQARDALDHGDAESARDLVSRAYEADPNDPDVRELYAALHLAYGVRLAAQASEARRMEILRRNIGYDEEFEDSPEVTAAFDRALAVIEEALRANPSSEKAIQAKASLLFRRDRRAGRPAALEILQKVQADHPANRQVAFVIRKIERPCPRCSDTGFCPYCRARGLKRYLGFERECERCHGRGICPACGIL